MEDDQKKWKTNQSTKINLIGCDTIVNSPSSGSAWLYSGSAWLYSQKNGMKIVAYLSLLCCCTHFTRTNLVPLKCMHCPWAFQVDYGGHYLPHYFLYLFFISP
jgi:hypothetical protein